MAENTVDNEGNLHSQSSQLKEKDLQKLEADSVPVNTKKQTSWDLKKFTQWLEKLKISCDLHTVSPAELNGILRKCFAVMKTNKKTDLTPRANPKTLTPGPRIPTTDWVRGPPYRPDQGLPLRTPSTEHPENKIKIRNKYFTHGLSNNLLVSAKFRTFQCTNVTFLVLGSSASYTIIYCHFFWCGHTVY